MKTELYNDGRYIVTNAVISTPTRYYPISNATARIRYDTAWLAIAASALTYAAVATYGDLLKPEEVSIGVAVCVGLIFAAAFVRVLSIDAVGHKRILIIGSTRRIERLFRAIRSAASPSNFVAEMEAGSP